MMSRSQWQPSVDLKIAAMQAYVWQHRDYFRVRVTLERDIPECDSMLSTSAEFELPSLEDALDKAHYATFRLITEGWHYVSSRS